MSRAKKVDHAVEKVWEEFWAPLLVRRDGTIKIEQLKNELFDFYNAMEEVPKVYQAVTNGHMSKITYHASAVIQEYEDCFNKEVEEAVREGVKDEMHSLYERRWYVRWRRDLLQCIRAARTKYLR